MPAQTPPVLERAPAAGQVTAAPLPDPKTLGRGEWEMHAIRQEGDGPIKRLIGHAEMEDNTLLLRADEIVYNEDTTEWFALPAAFIITASPRTSRSGATAWSTTPKNENGKF